MEKADQPQSPTSAGFQITKDLLKPWLPCTDGYKWFLDKFPQGGAYTAVQAALRADSRFNDVRWLTEQVWTHLIFQSPELTADVVQSHKDESDELIAQTTALKVEIKDGEDASGNYAQIGSSGNYAQIGSSGHDARIGSSGHEARINATGANAVICCAGAGSAAAAGDNGVIALPWFDKAANRTRIAVGYVGETIKPGTLYKVDAAGKFVEEEL